MNNTSVAVRSVDPFVEACITYAALPWYKKLFARGPKQEDYISAVPEPEKVLDSNPLLDTYRVAQDRAFKNSLDHAYKEIHIAIKNGRRLVSVSFEDAVATRLAKDFFASHGIHSNIPGYTFLEIKIDEEQIKKLYPLMKHLL